MSFIPYKKKKDCKKCKIIVECERPLSLPPRLSTTIAPQLLTLSKTTNQLNMITNDAILFDSVSNLPSGASYDFDSGVTFNVRTGPASNASFGVRVNNTPLACEDVVSIRRNGGSIWISTNVLEPFSRQTIFTFNITTQQPGCFTILSISFVLEDSLGPVDVVGNPIENILSSSVVFESIVGVFA